MLGAIQLRSTQNFGQENGVKVIVYGKAGMGKTTLCATCPAPVVLSAEAGLLSLARYNIPFIEITSISDLRDAYVWAKSSHEAQQFQTLCLDSVSEIGERVLSHYMNLTKDGRKAYGEMIVETTKVIKEFRDLPRWNIYMTAKQERIKNEATGALLNGPMMPGNKMAQAVPYFPDELFQLDVEGFGPNAYRYLRTQPDLVNDAKDRSGVLAPMEPPDIGFIFEKIRAHGQLDYNTYRNGGHA